MKMPGVSDYFFGSSIVFCHMSAALCSATRQQHCALPHVSSSELASCSLQKLLHITSAGIIANGKGCGGSRHLNVPLLAPRASFKQSFSHMGYPFCHCRSTTNLPPSGRTLRARSSPTPTSSCCRRRRSGVREPGATTRPSSRATSSRRATATAASTLSGAAAGCLSTPGLPKSALAAA